MNNTLEQINNLEFAEMVPAMPPEQQRLLASKLETSIMLDELINRFNYATSTLEKIQGALNNAH